MAHLGLDHGAQAGTLMVHTVCCSGCRSSLRVKAEYLGRVLRCPTCGERVQTWRVDQKAVVGPERLHRPWSGYVERAEPTPRGGSPASSRGACQGPHEGSRDEKPSAGSDTTLPARASCPRCGADSSERVDWTFWGSYYGPPLVNHVRCLDCGYRFNGATGRSNRLWAFLFMTVPVLIIAGMVGGLVLLFHYAADEDSFRRPYSGADMSWGAPVSPPVGLQPSGFEPPFRQTPAGSGGLP